MDEIDIAQELEERHRSAAIAAVTRPMRSVRVPVAFDCVDCHQPIDPRRLMVLPEALRCIDCQRLLEARGV